MGVHIGCSLFNSNLDFVSGTLVTSILKEDFSVLYWWWWKLWPCKL